MYGDVGEPLGNAQPSDPPVTVSSDDAAVDETCRACRASANFPGNRKILMPSRAYEIMIVNHPDEWRHPGQPGNHVNGKGLVDHDNVRLIRDFPG